MVRWSLLLTDYPTIRPSDQATTNMIPYANFLYFGVLLMPTLISLLIGLLRVLKRAWILIATLLMLVIQYSSTLNITPSIAFPEIGLVLLYAAYEAIVLFGFAAVRPRVGGRLLFYAAIVLALLPLIISKFAPVLAPNTLIGFLGISYVTFRTIDVVIGIQDKLIQSLSPFILFSYLFFFPTISAGPIDRYRRFSEDWHHQRTRAEFVQDLDRAVHLIFRGFLYSFIVAVLIRRYWLDPASAGGNALNTLSYMYAYSAYLFFDFAGYSAFAIGISYLFGIHTPENFNRPFLATSIRDFWNRWHITLSAWFRDHVYMRFVLAATKGRWFKSRYLASYLGLLITFGLMGLWHGIAWYYIIYGLYHAALLIGYEMFDRWNKKHKVWGDGLAWRAVGTVLTVNAVCFGLLIFSGYLAGVPTR